VVVVVDVEVEVVVVVVDVEVEVVVVVVDVEVEVVVVVVASLEMAGIIILLIGVKNKSLNQSKRVWAFTSFVKRSKKIPITKIKTFFAFFIN